MNQSILEQYIENFLTRTGYDVNRLFRRVPIMMRMEEAGLYVWVRTGGYVSYVETFHPTNDEIDVLMNTDIEDTTKTLRSIKPTIFGVEYPFEIFVESFRTREQSVDGEMTIRFRPF